MQFIDPKFRKNEGRYVLQSLLATLALVVVLAILDAISDAAIVGALGASSFIAFTMPYKHVSEARYLVGGYAVGVISGVACYYASVLLGLSSTTVFGASSSVVFGALAVGLAIFIMVVANLEHPPAAGVALGLVLNQCDALAIIVIIVGIVALSIVKTMMKPLLIDLL